MSKQHSESVKPKKKVHFDEPLNLSESATPKKDSEKSATKKRESKKSSSKTPEKKKTNTTSKKEPKAKRPKSSEAKTTQAKERRWDDLKDAEEGSYLTGPFTTDELKKLQDSIIEYAVVNGLTEDAMMELVTTSSKEKYKNAWIEIASVLPQRKVQSCHAVCKRKFNPNNYKGRWTDEETEFLLDYVENKGREWEKIGSMLGRTALNVRDKFKELGEGNHANRVKDKWTLEETIKLFKLVQKYTGIEFVNTSIDILTEEEIQGDYHPKRISKNNPHFQPDAIMVNIVKF